MVTISSNTLHASPMLFFTPLSSTSYRKISDLSYPTITFNSFQAWSWFNFKEAGLQIKGIYAMFDFIICCRMPTIIYLKTKFHNSLRSWVNLSRYALCECYIFLLMLTGSSRPSLVFQVFSYLPEKREYNSNKLLFMGKIIN